MGPACGPTSRMLVLASAPSAQHGRATREVALERGKLPNILAVDFALTGDVVGVAAELNGLAAAPERSTP